MLNALFRLLRIRADANVVWRGKIGQRVGRRAGYQAVRKLFK